VRVVTIPGFSVELCGGTHARATGDIGLFTVVQEGGVAAGVRRIDALTGDGALHDYQMRRETLHTVVSALGVSQDQAAEAVARLQTEARRLTREVQELKVKLAMGGGAVPGGAETGQVDLGGIKAVFRSVPGLDKSALREFSDSLKTVVLASAAEDGKVAIVASVTPDLKGRLHAGNIVKVLAPIVGGGGGGRPDFAEAGGKDPSKIDAMLAEARTVIEQMVRGPGPVKDHGSS